MRKTKNKIAGTPAFIVLKTVDKNGKWTRHTASANKRRFLNKTRLINWGKLNYATISVRYHPEKNYLGKMQVMHNDMKCKSADDLKWAYTCFISEYEI